MKKTLIYKTAALLPLVGLISCVNELDVETSLIQQPTTQIEVNANPHHIELSEAIDNMYAFMDEVGFDQTRGHERGKWHVLKVKLSDLKGHTRNTNTEDTEALYVVNFEDNNGFAVLAADDRMADPVIAMSTNGNLEFEPKPREDMENELTREDLLVIEDNDYMLGALGEDEFISGLITNYSTNHNTWTDSLRDNTDEFGDPILPPLNPIDYHTEGVTSLNYPALLTTEWSQGYPFNYFCPKRYYRRILGVTTSFIEDFDYAGSYQYAKSTKTGCVATAVAQIIAYHEYPSTSEIIETTLPVSSWQELKAIDWDNYPTTNVDSLEAVRRNHIARIMRKIGDGCDMWYGFWDLCSFTTPQKAASYLSSLGYYGVVKHTDYNSTKVKECISTGRPVFMGAISGLVNGHAWVIDGYKEIEWYRVGEQDDVEVSRTHTSTSKYVHCNWGWGGLANGWFVSGAFDVSNAYSYDNGQGCSDESNYDFWMRMVTYEWPNVNY